MPKYKRRNTKSLLVQPTPEKIIGRPDVIKIKLFRGVVFFGIVRSLSETNLSLQICKIENGLKVGEWSENDIVSINPQTIEKVIKQI